MEQTSTLRGTILFPMGGAPFLCILIGMAAFTRFRLTNAAHARIRRALDERTRDAERQAVGA